MMDDWVVDPQEQRERETLLQETRAELLACGGETTIRRPGLPPVRVWLDGDRIRMDTLVDGEPGGAR